MKKFIIIALLFSPMAMAMAGKPTLIFDLDETLVWRTEHKDLADHVGTTYDEMLRYESAQDGKTIYYFFVPYVKAMLRHLLDRGFEIHFFSTGSESRNRPLVDFMLTSAFGTEVLRKKLKEGQFKVFSRGHAKVQLLPPSACVKPKQDKNAIRKCLKKIFPDRSLDDLILIDNLQENAQIYDETDVITEHGGGTFSLTRTFSPSVEQFPVVAASHHPDLLPNIIEHPRSLKTLFALNHAVYFTGLFEHAYNLMREKKIPLRHAVSEVMGPCAVAQKEGKYHDPEDSDFNPSRDVFLKTGSQLLEKYDEWVIVYDEQDIWYFNVE